MPVYLCQVGEGEEEPWKYGIPVFPHPIPMEDDSNDVVLVKDEETLRKVMHAQVVLVDDVCIAHGRYWLRLRWPGNRGGFAGYIGMGSVGTFV